MTKVMLFLMICSGLIFASCGTGKQASAPVSIEGEWNIVEVDGSSLAWDDNGHLPTIGFDAKNHRIYGNSGCNRMMGTYAVDSSKKNSLSFGQMGSTRMACPDMSVEQKVLGALQKVTSYKLISCDKSAAGACKIALYGKDGKTIVVIEKAAAGISSLNGEWKIAEVNGKPVGPSEKEPFLGFDIQEKTVYGSAGCNGVNGSFSQDKKNPLSLSFGHMAATMMECPDMSTEASVLGALNVVRSFAVLESDNVALCDADGKQVILLVKK